MNACWSSAMSPKGYENDIQPYIQKRISIPRIGNAESLNAAVATGIILATKRLKV
jgi:TrmH family RNA methyltransferase